ncbi:MAG: FAD-dependent oxidoreductase, partial [Dokdonella sp.]
MTMDIKSGDPWWSISNGLISTWPELVDDRSVEIVVVGAGVTGALVADSLVEAGHEVLMIDRRDVGTGSTSASTAMLQYELDVELQDLAEMYDAQSAVSVYRACESAIDDLEAIVDRLPGKAGFKRNRSLYFAGRHLHRRRLQREFEIRRKHGFDVELLDAAELRAEYNIDSPIALLTANAARIDPYRFTHALLRDLAKRGVAVFDRSEMCDYTAQPDHLELRMASGATLRCQHMVIAAGYESQQYLPRNVANIRSSYALVTEPLERL